MGGEREREVNTSLREWSVLGEDPVGVDRTIFQTTRGMWLQIIFLRLLMLCVCFVFNPRTVKSNMVATSHRCLFKLTNEIK